MTLSANDVNGIRQESYMLIPIDARRANPGFWGWSSGYRSNSTGHRVLKITLDDGGGPYESRIYDVPERSEFRLCTELHRRGAAYVGHVLLLRRIRKARYSGRIVSPGDPNWASSLAGLTNLTRSATKLWGYV
jgi:hypothetical protein